LALTAEIAVDAAQLRFSNDPFDRIIYATARAAGGRLVTRDHVLLEFDPKLTIW
jgi:PIN domain nuclease of toxin-antitoxin system